MNEILVQALKQYDLDRCPLPVSKGEKHPIVSWKEYQNKRPSREQVIEWFKEGDKNIFLLTGEQYNLIVVDIDVNDYLMFSEDAEGLIKQFPETLHSMSGSGGHHYFFTYPKGMNIQSKAGVFERVDIRADGGGIIIPPSIHKNGNQYEWLDEFDLADFPYELFKEVLENRSSEKNESKVSEKKIKVGKRNSTLLRHAGSIFKNYSDRPELAKSLVRGLNKELCEEPLSDYELENTIFSSMNKYFPLDEKQTKNWLSPLSKKELVKKEFEEQDYIVDSLIPTESTCILSGDPASYKTWLELEIANCVASGRALFNCFSVKQGGVWIIDKENKPSAIKKRFNLLGGQEDLPIFVSSSKEYVVRSETTDEMIDFCEKNNIKLVIIDSFRRCHDGDENSSKDVNKVLEQVSRLHKHGVSILFTHHHRKSQGLETKATSKMRGSTDILANLDTHLIVEVTQPQELRIELNKSRYDQAIKPFSLKIDTDTTSYFKFVYSGDALVQKSKQDQAKDFIERKMSEKNEISRQELVETAKLEISLDHNSIDRAINALIKLGKVHKHENKGKVFYKVN